MIVNTITKGLHQVIMSDLEVDTLNDYIPKINDYGIEVNEGANMLDRETLWFLLCELNGVNHHTKTSLDLSDNLKMVLYPEE